MAAVRQLEFAKIDILVKRLISACDSSSPFRNLHKLANMAPRYCQKTIFNMASVRHLEFAKFRFFVKWPSRELDFASAYQIWSKLDNSRLRYGGNAIFKMAAVRHLEFAKIEVLVTWPISACDPSFLLQISRWSANMAPRYSQKKRFSIWRPSAILNLQNFDFFCQICMLGIVGRLSSKKGVDCALSLKSRKLGTWLE